MRSFLSLFVSFFACLSLCQHAHAITSEKARIFRIDGQGFTRPRDCSAWGLGNNPVPEAFKYDYDDPLNTCDGVMNMFYYFKIITFAAELETSVLLRALKGISEVSWNAWAHYHVTATDTLGKLRANPARRQPKSQWTKRNKNIAIAFALTRLAAHILPSAADEATIVLAQLVGDSLSKYTTANTKSPQGIGNLVAKELIAALKADGWNADGSRSPGNAFPFADYTNYRPVNSEFEITNPTRYQPLVETDKNGYFFKQFHTTPQLRHPSVKPWSVKRSWIDARTIAAPWGKSLTGKDWEWYKGNVSLVIRASASLTEKQKLIAEFFDNKVISFGGFERWFAHKNNWCHDDFIQYDQLSACLHDGTILAWKEKIRIDAIRPASAIRYLRSKGVLPSKIRSWGGQKNNYKTASIDPNDWQSYLRTMPHSEFPSGTSCVCQIWSDWTRLFQKGSDKLDLTLNWKQGCSSVEQGVTPKKATSHTFRTLTEAHNTCIQSRVWAGVHFQASVTGGATVCKGVAQQCYKKVQRLLNGNPSN